MVHGSDGIYDAMFDCWLKRFNASGLAVLSLDTFGPRGVKSIAEDQSLVPFAADTADAFVAIPGVQHKFDADDTRKIMLSGAQRTVDDCPLEPDIDASAVLDRKTGQRPTGDALAARHKACAAVGANVQGDKAARDKAADAIRSFLTKVLAPG